MTELATGIATASADIAAGSLWKLAK